MFGVLEVILRQDTVPGQSFGASQGQIAFLVSLEVLRVSRLGAEERGRFVSLDGSGSLRHSVGQHLRIWARLRRRRFQFGNVFHCQSVYRSGGSRATFI
jgi:hypothetical protein